MDTFWCSVLYYTLFYITIFYDYVLVTIFSYYVLLLFSPVFSTCSSNKGFLLEVEIRIWAFSHHSQGDATLCNFLVSHGFGATMGS